MGPSGGGKSTLMSVLLGKLNFSGSLQTNGKFKEMKSYIGFVPQDDIMIPTLTVREVLMHSAMMRLPPSRSYDEKVEIVNNVLKVLQLESIQDSIIGNAMDNMGV
jgi:ABC-type multidrug transport system ATPase subunit